MAELDDDAGVLVGVGAALGSNDVGLAVVGLAYEYVGVLDDGGRVAEDEVDGAEDVAFSVELPLGVDAEGVLVPLDAAAVEDGLVGSGEQCDCLRARPVAVAECYAGRDESVAEHA